MRLAPMKRYATALLFCTLSLTSLAARADIIDDAIGNIQQAINDAYNPGSSRSDDDDRYDDDGRYDDGRYQGSRQQSRDSQRQYDERQRQLDERRRQLDERQRQLDRDRRQLESDQRRLDDSYCSPPAGQRLIQRYFHPVIARFETCRQRVIHHPDVKLVADMGEDHPRTANDLVKAADGV